MSFPNGPMATMAPSLIRLAQFVQRKKMAKQGTPQESHLPGEPPMSQQIAQANSLQIDPRFLPPQPQPPQPLPPAPPPQGGMPMPDDMGRAPSPRIAQLAGQSQTPQPFSPSFPQPAPLDIPERVYDMPPVVDPPTLAPAPRRNVAKESNRALQSALIPAGLGLLLGGAPGALAAASGAVAGNRARADQEAAVENQAFQTDRANTLQQYGMDRQKSGDELARVSQQMRVDATKDNAMYRVRHEEWVAWNKEQDRLAKARSTQEADSGKVVPALLTHRAKTAELMSTQPEAAQRRVASDFNEIAASLGRPDLGFSVPEKGPVFAMQPKDVNRGALAGLANARTEQVPVIAGNTVAKTQAEIDNINADNKRADGQAQFDQWYKKRQIDISQGRLNAATEKANLDKANKGIGSWEAAQKEIAVRMAQAAKLSEIKKDILGDETPPTEDELLAANLYRESADSLAAKFGKVRENGKWVSVNMGPPATAPNTSQYSLPSGGEKPVTLPPVQAKGQTVRATLPSPPISSPAVDRRLRELATPSPRATPRPTPKPRPTPAPKKATVTPKPSATPLPRRKDGKLDTSKLTEEQLRKIMLGKK